MIVKCQGEEKMEKRYANNIYINNPNFGVKNIRQWKIYREKRDEFISGKVCEVCGSNEDLAIHHHWIFWGHKWLKMKIDFALKKHGIELSDLEKSQIYEKIMNEQIEIYLSFKKCRVLCKSCHKEEHIANCYRFGEDGERIELGEKWFSNHSYHPMWYSMKKYICDPDISC